MPPEFPLLYKIVLAILGLLFCHINLIIVLSRSVKKFDGILMGITLNLQIGFGRIAIFTMLILPIQEQGRSFHFLNHLLLFITVYILFFSLSPKPMYIYPTL